MRTLLRAALLVIVSSIAIQSYLRLSNEKISNVYIQRPIQGFQAMVDGTSGRPFVARALVPFIVRRLAGLIPPDAGDALMWPLVRMRFPFPEEVAPGQPGHVDLRSYAVWLYLGLLSMALLAVGIRRVLVHYYQGPAWLFDAAAAAGVLAWPSLIWYANYVYDVATPAIVVWLMLFAIKRQWAAYYGLLGLAAFHKETMVVVPVAFAYLYWPERPRRRLLAEVAVQFAMVAGVRLYLSLSVFSANPGHPFNIFWYDNHNVSASVWLAFLPTAVIIGTLVGGLALANLADKPRGIKALALTVVPLLIMAIPFGYIDEIRQYAEGYPGLVCLAFPSLVNAFRPGLVRLRVDRG